MGRTFESQQGYGDDLEIGLDNFEFKSAGKKYINQNYKRIGAILGVEGEGLGVIKKQANRENKLPDIHGEIGLEQINFYRAHYDFSPLTQDEYETVKAQNTSSEAIIDEKLGKSPTEVVRPEIDSDGQETAPFVETKSGTTTASEGLAENEENIGTIIFENDDVENFEFNLKRYSGDDEMRVASIRDDLEELVLLEQSIDELLEQRGIPDIPSKSIKIGDEYFDWWDTHSSGYTYRELAIAQYYGLELDDSKAEGESVSVELTTGESPEQAKDFEGEGVAEDELPEAEALQAELDRLIEVEVAKLQREEIVENLSYKIDQGKLENFKENARKTIADYQQFANEHSSPADKANHQIQERYQLLEKYAWNSLYSLAHLLDGEIATLPQDRDIQLSHPEGVDTRQYLESMGYKFDENGDITHITNKGVEIELNRAMKTDSLIKSRRPSHIVYDKSISLDNDINYQGYLVRGLNHQTPDFIVGVLDKNNLENVIVDETTQSNPELDGNQEELAIVGNSGNVLNAEIVTQSTEQAEGVQMILSNKENTVDFEVVDDPESAKLLEEMEPIDLVDRLAELREQYARAEEAWNRKPGDEKLEDTFIAAREAYNTELERVLKLQVAEGQADNISKMFKDEVMSLRDSRIEQSQELQGKWEKRFNNAKEKFLGWATQNKTRWMLANISLFAAGALLSWTGAGIPVSGALEMTRRSLGSVMSGVSSRNTLVGLMEDGEINRFGIKFKAVIPKLVDESLKDDYINNASDDDLRTKLSTLEAYYRLNGGEFPNDNQKQAYEKVLTELARRVQENVIDAEQNQDELQSDWQEQKPENLTEGEILEKAHQRWDERNPLSRNMRYFLDRDIQKERDLQNKAEEDWKKSNPERYTSELLNTISDTRIAELDKFRRKRKIANVVGFATTGVLGGVLLNDMVKPGSMFRPDMEGGGKPHITGGSTPDTQGPGAGPGGAGAPEAGAVAPKPNLETTPPTGTGAATEEAVRQARAAAAVAAAAEQAQELAQDVSSLDSGETIWSQASKWLGPDASQGQIQEAVEKYLGSIKGQDTIFNLAQQTEGGRELLSQWGVDDAKEMASLSKDQLFEISRYLAPGELEGLTELSLDNLDALEQAEYLESSPVVEPTVESADTQPPASPSGTEAPSSPPAPEVSPVAGTEFTRGVSEALGANSLTEAQLQEVIHSFATSEQGSVELYNQIISNEEGARFLSGFGVDEAADFANIRPDEVYEIAQTVGVENLDKLPGFELNEIILSKLEDAPDTVELVMGLSPLDAVQRYVANELGDLPYDSSLPKNIIHRILDTDEGKEWFLKSITENPDGAPAKGDIRFMHARLFFNRNGITQGSDIDWNKLDQLRNGFVRHKIFWQDLPFKVDDKTVNLSLSRLLKPGPIPGIKDAVRQVLTR